MKRIVVTMCSILFLIMTLACNTVKDIESSPIVFNVPRYEEKAFFNSEAKPFGDIYDTYDWGYKYVAGDTFLRVSDTKIPYIKDGFYYSKIYDERWVLLPQNQKELLATALTNSLYLKKPKDLGICTFIDPITKKSIQVHINPSIMKIPGILYYLVWYNSDIKRAKEQIKIACVIGSVQKDEYFSLPKFDNLINDILQFQMLKVETLARGYSIVVDRSEYDKAMESYSGSLSDMFFTEGIVEIGRKISCDYVIALDFNFMAIKNEDNTYDPRITILYKMVKISEGIVVSSYGEIL